MCGEGIQTDQADGEHVLRLWLLGNLIIMTNEPLRCMCEVYTCLWSTTKLILNNLYTIMSADISQQAKILILTVYTSPKEQELV